jgi:hypothetical protein
MIEEAKRKINEMFERSQTKLIFPVITLGLLKSYNEEQKEIFTNLEIGRIYNKTVQELKTYLGHDLHIGGKYYDAYPSRNLPKYGVLVVLGEKRYRLGDLYKDNAKALYDWLIVKIGEYIKEKLGIIIQLSGSIKRTEIANDRQKFINIVKSEITRNATYFEIFSFAIFKVHLEKFACKLYRDTRTAASDKGVDISTNFGVVYQIKKLRVQSIAAANNIYSELKSNFDKDRLEDGKVILIIEDVSKEIKQYLINMKVQSISKDDIVKLASHFEDAEDRMKVLRIVYEEFAREYASDI